MCKHNDFSLSGNRPCIVTLKYILIRGRINMEGQKVYGYMRVSGKDQNEDRQRLALLEMGVPERQIFMD